jgi:hypothetical protein
LPLKTSSFFRSFLLEVYAASLLKSGVGPWPIVVTSRNQRQIIAHHINRQGSKDKKHGNPETPIAMCALPVRAMNAIEMRSLFVVRVRALTHSLPNMLNVTSCS